MYDVLAMNAYVTQQLKRLNCLSNNTNPAQHQEYIGKPFPPKFWSTPVVHKGEVLPAKYYCSLAKSEE